MSIQEQSILQRDIKQLDHHEEDIVNDGPIAVYTPESRMNSPRLLLQSMYQGLKSSRELAWRLFVRDISALYRQSLLGILWAFLPPIATGLVFIILQSRNILNVAETDVPYPVFVFVGTVLWQLFTESLNAPLKSVRSAKPMLAKINFPHEALILSAFYTVLFNLLIKSLVLIGIFLFFQIEITWGLLLVPAVLALLILCGMTIGLFITPFGMLYTDIAAGLSIVTQLWFFVTPVIYPSPQTFPYSLMAILNPVSPLITAGRDLITKGVITNVIPLIAVGSITFIGLFLAWIIYRAAMPIIIERMSA